MPLRPYGPPILPSRPHSRPIPLYSVPPAHRFHSSPHPLSSPLENHYTALDLSPSASPAEIKKQFYSLSKKCHPDRNPSDPEASSKFARISTAYSVLSDSRKRARYDRDFARANPEAYGHRGSNGSYYSGSGANGTAGSSGPAGGRSPSGLSRRRTQFRGPPPSFYRSGGWGSHSERRRRQAEAGHAAGSGFGGSASANGEGMGGRPTSAEGAQSGPTPFADQFGLGDEVSHFDREGHFRTQENVDGRRRRRLRREEVPVDSNGGSSIWNFFLVSGIVAAALLPTVFYGARFR